VIDDVLQTLPYDIKFKNAVFHKKQNLIDINILTSIELPPTAKSVIESKIQETFNGMLSYPECKEDIVINYKFNYSLPYLDEILLQLKVLDFLKKFPSILADKITADNVKISANSYETFGGASNENFEINLYLTPQFAKYCQNSAQFAQFKMNLERGYFSTFKFSFINQTNVTSFKSIIKDKSVTNPRLFDIPPVPVLAPLSSVNYSVLSMISSQKQENLESSRIDKTVRVENVQYLLGVPVKYKPVKPEFINVSPDTQITAGEISKLQKKEYTSKKGDRKTFMTFNIDGLRCVAFPTKKNLRLFDQLRDGHVIVAAGVYSAKNDFSPSFMITGISTCNLRQ
jgi:hypothetical protein